MMALSSLSVCVAIVAILLGAERLSLLGIVAFLSFIASWGIHDAVNAKYGKYCTDCIEDYPGETIGSDNSVS